MAADHEEVLQFWFGDSHDAAEVARTQESLWWGGRAETDALIRRRFAALHGAAVSGELASWERTARGRLALIILVDQFSRGLFRGRPQAFLYDVLAQEWCRNGLRQEFDLALRPIERVFFYLPLEHAESPELQARSVELYEALVAVVPAEQHELFEGYADYARRHREVVQRFGRFPHRNAVLGRQSSAEELELLKQPGAAF
jgi:uncharacterized protein (DUF924 family)